MKHYSRAIAVTLTLLMGYPSLGVGGSANLRALRKTPIGTEVEQVKTLYGYPEFRTVLLTGDGRTEELLYRIDSKRMARLLFENGKLAAVGEKAAATGTPGEHQLTPEELQRRGRLLSLALGWDSQRAEAWAKPDAVVSDQENMKSNAQWPGGDTWFYATGPWLTLIRVNSGRVVEFADMRLDPRLIKDDFGVKKQVPQNAKAIESDSSSASGGFWKGVGTLLGAVALGYLAYEALDGKDLRGATPSTAQPQIIHRTGTVIESRIDGEFQGWDGDTVFVLQNGQIWRQTEYSYRYHYAYNPKVTLVRTRAGWELIVEGVKETIKVEQLK